MNPGKLLPPLYPAALANQEKNASRSSGVQPALSTAGRGHIPSAPPESAPVPAGRRSSRRRGLEVGEHLQQFVIQPRAAPDNAGRSRGDQPGHGRVVGPAEAVEHDLVGAEQVELPRRGRACPRRAGRGRREDLVAEDRGGGGPSFERWAGSWRLTWVRASRAFRAASGLDQLGERPLVPQRRLLELHRHAGGPSDEAVAMARETAKAASTAFGSLRPWTRFGPPGDAGRGPRRCPGSFDRDRFGGRTGALVGDAIEARLREPAADLEVHRPVLRVDDHVGQGQRRAGQELLQLAGVRRALWLEMQGIELAVAPVAEVQGLLVLRRETLAP